MFPNSRRTPKLGIRLKKGGVFAMRNKLVIEYVTQYMVQKLERNKRKGRPSPDGNMHALC